MGASAVAAFAKLSQTSQTQERLASEYEKPEMDTNFAVHLREAVGVPEAPKMWSVKIIKPQVDASLGINLDTVGGICGLVTEIRGGAVMTYNASVADDAQIRRGDFIMG